MMWSVIVLLVVGLFNLFQNSKNTVVSDKMPFSEFLKNIDDGRVVQVEIKGELLNYFKDAKFLRSSLRMIPFSEDNLDTAKRLAKIIYKNRPLRVRWRGTRKHHPDHTIKSEATHFDVYVR